MASWVLMTRAVHGGSVVGAGDVLVRDRGHQPGLDGVRGVAILMVLGQHAPTRPLIDGFVGVTVFFCLSGYLVTTVLVRQLQTGTIDVRAFYRRRAARLFPGLLTVVSATIVVLLIGRKDLSIGQILAPAGASVTYTTSIFDWTDHVFATKDYFNYTWSLSVEEQFYLLWPLALLWAYRHNPRLFAALIVSLIGVTSALDLYLGLSRKVQYDQHEYFGSDTNALPVLVGSLLAIVVLNGWLSQALRRLAPCALLGLALLPVLAYRNDTYSPSLVIVAGTGLIVRDLGRRGDQAEIGGWVVAGKRALAVAGRTVVLDLSLECSRAYRSTHGVRTYGSR